MNEESKNGCQPINGAELANQQGVVVPPSAVAHSAAVKAARRKTLAQLPVYRASANLLYVVLEIVKRMPMALRKFSDAIVADSCELLKVIGFAETSRSDEDRVYYINSAYVIVSSMRDYIKILGHLGVIPPVKSKRARKGEDTLSAPRIDKIDSIDKDMVQKIEALIRSILAQLVAWRENPRGQGAPSSPTPKK